MEKIDLLLFLFSKNNFRNCLAELVLDDAITRINIFFQFYHLSSILISLQFNSQYFVSF